MGAVAARADPEPDPEADRLEEEPSPPTDQNEQATCGPEAAEHFPEHQFPTDNLKQTTDHEEPDETTDDDMPEAVRSKIGDEAGPQRWGHHDQGKDGDRMPVTTPLPHHMEKDEPHQDYGPPRLRRELHRLILDLYRLEGPTKFIDVDNMLAERTFAAEELYTIYLSACRSFDVEQAECMTELMANPVLLRSWLDM